MANLFIFGIGGTGARIIRAFSMLLAANGGQMGDTMVFPMIIDYDVQNGDKDRALKALELYSKIHNGIYNGTTLTDSKNHKEEGFFSTEVTNLTDAFPNSGYKSTYTYHHTIPSTSETYSRRIGHSSLNGNLQITQYLLNSLYNTSTNQEIAELHIDTRVGFRGNPNIGSVLLNDMNNSQEFKDFEKQCSPGDRVVIIGSLFGGTGASGIPVLVKSMKNSKRTAVQQAKIATLLIEPYFKISDPDKNKLHEGVIDDKIFESKTKAALHYYEDTLSEDVDAFYYLGDRIKNQVEHHPGKETQKNDAHILELIGAMAIAHFHSLNDETLSQLDPNGKKMNHWKYGFNVDIEENKELDFSMFAHQSLDDIKKFIAYALAGVTLTEYIDKKDKDIVEQDVYKIPFQYGKGFVVPELLDNFKKFFEFFKDWMKELGKEGAQRRLKNFNFNPEKISDILVSHPFEEAKKALFSKKLKKEPVLSINDIFNELQSVYFDIHNSNKVLNSGETPQYAFFDSLYESCNKLVNDKLQLEIK